LLLNSKENASRAVYDVYNHVPQGTKDYFAAASEQLFSRQRLRPISVVFGMGEERPFYLERAPSLVVERVRHNVSFFYLNYMLLTAILFGLTVLITPTAILGLGLLAVAWMYTIRSAINGQLHIGAIAIQQKHASILLTIVSVFVMFHVLHKVFWWTLLSSTILVLSHALSRDASLHKDAEDKVDMQGDLPMAVVAGTAVEEDHGEDAPFLNSP
jgi:PRA1 family protein